MTDTSQPIKGIPFDVGFYLYNSGTGKVLNSPAGLSARVVCEAHPTGAVSDNTPAIVDESSGAGVLTLSAYEMDSDMIEVKISSTDEFAMDYCCVLYTVTSTVSEEVTWTYVLTSTVDGSPVDNALVWVTTDVSGTNTVGEGITDLDGSVTFSLEPATYYVWRSKIGWSFTNPDTEVVS